VAYLFSGKGSQRGRLAYAVLMQIRVLYFGVLKDLMGQSSTMMEVAEGSTVAELLVVHRGLAKAPESLWDSLAVAMNHEYARAGDLLKEGDEVALLPPVSGGTGMEIGDCNAD
jgi:molybdopterin converting factor subunit 1